MKNLVILTSLFFNKVGNQSLLETVREYSKHYKVYIITSSSEAESFYKSFEEANLIFSENVLFFRSPQFFHKLMRKIIKAKENSIFFKKSLQFTEIDNSLINLRYNFWNIMSFKVSYFILIIYTVSLFLKKRIPVPDVICAYEIGGVFPSVFLRKFFFKKSKLLAKMQGTILFNYLKDNKLKDSEIQLDVEAYYLLNKFNLVTMTNDGTYGDIVLDFFNVRRDNYIFLTNGISKQVIDIKKELEYNLPANNSKIILSSVSRLIGWKRVYLSVEIMNFLINKLNNKIFFLNIYGYGNEVEVDYLKSLIKKYNLNEFVNIIGEVSHEEVSNIFMKSDFLLSLYKFTNVTNPLLEAVYLNVPIISIMDDTLSKIVSHDINQNIFLFSDNACEKDLVIEIATFLNNCEISEIRRIRIDNYFNEFSFVNSWEERVNLEVKKLVEC
jgi:glycosyltransferase involved in cell wall biosynthesis